MRLRDRIRRTLTKSRAEHALNNKLYGLLEVLSDLKQLSDSKLLTFVFRRLKNGQDTRRWTFLSSIRKPSCPAADKVSGLERDIKTFIQGIRQSAKNSSQGVVLKLSLGEETKLGRKILAKSARLHTQISRLLKPEYAKQESYMETRPNLPRLDTSDASSRQQLLKALQEHSSGVNIATFIQSDLPLQTRFDEQVGDDQEPDVEPIGLSKQLSKLRASDFHQKQQQQQSSPQEVSESSKTSNRLSGENIEGEDVKSSSGSAVSIEWLQHYQRSANGASSIIDIYTLCVQCMITALAFAEILEQNRVYSSTMASATKVASQFVRFGLPLLERLMDGCDPDFTKRNIFPLSFHGIGSLPIFQSSRQLIRRLSVLDDMMSSMDLLILPSRIHCHDGAIKSLCHSHLDPTYIASGGADAVVRVFNSLSGKCVAQLPGHESIITWVAFSEFDNRIYSASFDGTVREWVIRKAECTRIFRGHQDAVLAGDISPDFSVMATGSMDRTCRLWDLRSGNCLYVLQRHTNWVKVVKFGPKGRRLVSAGLDCKVVVWKLNIGSEHGPRVESLVRLHNEYVLDLCVCANRTVISSSKDKSIKVWQLQGGSFEFDVLNGGWVRTLALSPDESLVCSGSFDNCVSLFRTKSGLLLRRFRLHNSGILKLIFLDNRTIACADSAGYVQFIDL